MSKRLSWLEKLHNGKAHKIKTIEKCFGDMAPGDRMLVATPLMVDNYIRNIPYGTAISFSRLREDLATEHNADKTCPTSTGIFLRIVAETAYEALQQGMEIEDITPFWRVINEEMPTAKKLTFGVGFLKGQREKGGIN